MIVIVRGDVSAEKLAHKLARRGVDYTVLDEPIYPPTYEWRLEVDESFRKAIRNWFAEDDDCLWFSAPGETEA